MEEDFLYHMDDYSDDRPFWDAVDGRPIVIMPYALDTNDMKLWTSPAYTARGLAAIRDRHVRPGYGARARPRRR